MNGASASRVAITVHNFFSVRVVSKKSKFAYFSRDENFESGVFSSIHNREHAGGRDTDALRVTFAARREQNKTVARR